MEEESKAAVLEISPEFLAELLQLPPGAYIDLVDIPYNQPDVLYVRIRGAGWPTKTGHIIQRAMSTVTAEYGDDGKIIRSKIEWDFPQ